MVAIDVNKTLKFYEFIDKVKKEEEEKRIEYEEKIHRGLKEMFDKYDKDKSGKLNYDECKLFLKYYFDDQKLPDYLRFDEIYKSVFD